VSANETFTNPARTLGISFDTPSLFQPKQSRSPADSLVLWCEFLSSHVLLCIHSSPNS
jgi:hypothetical protein